MNNQLKAYPPRQRPEIPIRLYLHKEQVVDRLDEMAGQQRRSISAIANEILWKHLDGLDD